MKSGASPRTFCYIMSTETIDSNELNTLRQQAASAIPWSHEATRLAEALYVEHPGHPLLRGEPWKNHFEAKEKYAVEPIAAAEIDALDTMAEEAVPDGE